MIKFIPVILVILTGCGKSTTSSYSSNNQETIYQNTYIGTPIFLTKQSSSCASKAFAENPLYDLNLLLSGRSASVQKNFSNLITSSFLADSKQKIVSSTYYGQVRHYWRVSTDTIRITEYKAPTPVFVCPEDTSYNRNSVESAALNINYYIHQTYNKIKEAASHLKIKPVSVNVAPFWQEYQRTGSTQRKVLAQTDNAYYLSDLREIIFLPASSESKRRGEENLWEIPSVITHEYAHHIFSTLFPLNETQKIHEGCFGIHMTGANEGKSETVDFVLSSLNEGFADLIGFYALSIEERGFIGMGSGASERSIYSAYFNNGFVKNFNNYTLFIHNDPHNVGAIFAYLVNKVFQEIGASDLQKISVLLNWVTRIESNHSVRKNLAASTYLEEAYMDFLNTVINDLNPADFKVCAHLFDHYRSVNLFTKNGCISPKKK